jgi:hypothetical protein
MATHATALRKQVSPKIQGVSSLRNSILGVTLLTSGFGVFLLEHGPEPELVLAMSFYFAGGCASVSPVTTRTPELFGFVNRQYFFIWVAYEGTRPGIRRLPWSIGGHVFWSNVERFSNAGVTNFTPVHDIVFIDTDLMAQD